MILSHWRSTSGRPFSQAEAFRKFTAIGRMPALVLESGETLIESGAILDDLNEVAGPSRALIPDRGEERRRSLRILASATAACDKAMAINYERRRPAETTSADWITRCRSQLDAALSAVEAFRLELAGVRRLQQTEITAACMFGYINRVETHAVVGARYPSLERLSRTCELRREFMACPP